MKQTPEVSLATLHQLKVVQLSPSWLEDPFKIPVCRLESQVLGQEHSEDAAQVVHSGWVEVGLGVSRRVPHSREGCGDEVEHRDTWKGHSSTCYNHQLQSTRFSPQTQKTLWPLNTRTLACQAPQLFTKSNQAAGKGTYLPPSRST